MIKIAPSVLSADFTKLGLEVLAAQEAGADIIHIDVMDGSFVPNLTVGPLVVEAINRVTDLPLDVHLMIDEPDRYIGDFVKAGADIITVHYEALKHLHRTVNWIRESGIKAGVSLNPATPLFSLDFILPDVDMVLLMSVNPGFGGQSFIPRTLIKIRQLREIIQEERYRVEIEVDGGVKVDNAAEIAQSGADILVMGSGFFNAGNYKQVIDTVRAKVNGNRQ
ncbi:MAG TPA: ribulose-phosphate 3-epimerase [Thermodesulfovibrionia bacterium]|nr:ribulose-phosphate 3-epimerase [Thermodesulfovibrionia bacterium]